MDNLVDNIVDIIEKYNLNANDKISDESINEIIEIIKKEERN